MDSTSHVNGDSPFHVNTAIGIGVSPALEAMLASEHAQPTTPLVDFAVVKLAGWGIVLGGLAAGASFILVRLINFVTNLAFFRQLSFAEASPVDNRLGIAVIFVPVIGGLIVGFMARYGSKAIRGHGIPEAMEQVLTNRSRIPARITWLKPLSAAIAIGTGGPFGAEGPIIATGGALGSLVGQVLSITAGERKVLLAAGAAAGMSATFGTPIAAVLLAVELLLFEFRARSLIPVALASCTAAGIRGAVEGFEPVFAMPVPQSPTIAVVALYAVIGALLGAIAVGVTRAVYVIEDAFERLPIHWMWWPAIGAVAVGVVSYFEPKTLGVGYQNISDIISNRLVWGAVIALGTLKLVSWSIALGSGTSGGTLAPLLTIGGCGGALLAQLTAQLAPVWHVDPRVGGLVGMAAMFTGASHAFLTSTVFAFETTLKTETLLPLLAGCTSAYLVSCLLNRNSIMTEKIARRGVLTPTGYSVDVLEQLAVRQVAALKVVTLRSEESLSSVRHWVSTGEVDAKHQGFPVLNDQGHVVGVLTRRDLFNAEITGDTLLGELIARPVIFTYDDCTVRQAADQMVNHDVGRLPVLTRSSPARLVGIITRSDILSAYRHRLDETHRRESSIIGARRPAQSAVRS